MLFYHHSLRWFVVIELKVGRFEQEYVPKMNFYLNAVDEQLHLGDDRASVGIILCAGGDATVAKLALHRVYPPIAVSTWRTGVPRPELPDIEITDEVPADLGELAELETVRARLIERVSQRGPGSPTRSSDANLLGAHCAAMPGVAATGRWWGVGDPSPRRDVQAWAPRHRPSPGQAANSAVVREREGDHDRGAQRVARRLRVGKVVGASAGLAPQSDDGGACAGRHDRGHGFGDCDRLARPGAVMQIVAERSPCPRAADGRSDHALHLSVAAAARGLRSRAGRDGRIDLGLRADRRDRKSDDGTHPVGLELHGYRSAAANQ